MTYFDIDVYRIGRRCASREPSAIDHWRCLERRLLPPMPPFGTAGLVRAAVFSEWARDEGIALACLEWLVRAGVCRRVQLESLAERASLEPCADAEEFAAYLEKVRALRDRRVAVVGSEW